MGCSSRLSGTGVHKQQSSEHDIEKHLVRAQHALPNFQWCKDTVLSIFALNPKFRQWLQTKMFASLEVRAVCSGAASLACLICPGSTAADVMAHARTRFRGVMASELGIDVLAASVPDPRHSALAWPCSLGSCDAYISHSWHDDGHAKWEAMKEWRNVFFTQHGREPVVWFDKCCIDQRNIEADLHCLPVFVKGCSHMVLLCGPSYLSRLWCILDLFIYFLMGGSLENIEFVPVLREGHESEDSSAIEQGFDTFDARECECFRQDDKERMLMLIGTAYGGMEDFNHMVRDIIKRHQKLSCTPTSKDSTPSTQESANV